MITGVIMLCELLQTVGHGKSSVSRIPQPSCVFHWSKTTNHFKSMQIFRVAADKQRGMFPF